MIGLRLLVLAPTALLVLLLLLGVDMYRARTEEVAHQSQIVTQLVAQLDQGWKSYNLQYEGASFKYPSNWSLDSDMIRFPKIDDAYFDGPNNFLLKITTGSPPSIRGVQPNSYDYNPTVLAADPVMFLGKPGYLQYISFSGGNRVDAVNLSPSPTDFYAMFHSRATEGKPNTGYFMVTAYYNGPCKDLYTCPSLTVAQAKADPNYQAAKVLIESMAY